MKYCVLLFLLVTVALRSDDWRLEGDYLLWKTKDAPVDVPLVTSASLNDPVPGALGQPGTKVLLGNKDVNIGWQDGFRFGIGGWFENYQQGVEGHFFMLPRKTREHSVSTSGEPGSLNVAVPIFDVTGLWGLNGVPGETIFILPGPLDGPGFKGTFRLKMATMLMGSDINGLACLWDPCDWQFDLIAGLRWLKLQESLRFTGVTAALPNGDESGFYNFKDRFETNNNFYGAQIGLKIGYERDEWLLDGFTKVAFGWMHQKLNIKGKSQTSNGNLFYETRNTGAQILHGGVFAEPTNRGSRSHNIFALAIEGGANLTYQLSCYYDIGLGYNFLWMNHLLRPGKQIDRHINPTRTSLAQASRESVGIGPNTPVPFGQATAAPLPNGPKRPKFKREFSNFWAQGLTVSLNLRF